jgi:hypothetical protein
MKKFMSSTIPVFICLIMITQLGQAQISFNAQTIDNDFNSPAGICSADIDLDGDLDVVACSAVNGIVWWKNEGGSPVTWSRHLVDDNTGGCLNVKVADIIRDGQPDIVTISYDRNQVVYYKNEGGDPITWSKQIVSSIPGEPHEVYVCDFDQDGYQDIFTANMGSSDITWWHNDGGYPAQWTYQQIDDNVPGARSVDIADIDGDGDQDIAGSGFESDEIIWWRNDGGNPINWSKHVVTNSFDGSHSVQIADMDNDGDMDLLGTAYMADEVSIWRNDGGDPISWTKFVVDNEFDGAVLAYAEDIDGDGFMEIYGTAYIASQMALYTNTGGEEFRFKRSILDDELEEVWPCTAGDFNGDCVMDIIVGGTAANEIRWYETKQVGRFTNNVEINGDQTFLGYFVPEDYDPLQKYKLIIALHFCGDGGEYSRYRDNLIETSVELNALLVTPDCGSNTMDIPEREVVLGALNHANKRFNIDPEYVYLTGGSCNGRTVLKYGLEKIYDFRGVIPFNPYLPEWTEGFYDFTSDMPVCFACGTLDQPNYDYAQYAYSQLMSNHGRAGFVSMPGVGHDFYIPEFTNAMLESILIIDSIAGITSSVTSSECLFNETKVFPNPFTDQINLQLSEDFHGDVSIRVSNLIGQELFSQVVHTQAYPRNLIHLDLKRCCASNNILMLQVSNNGNYFSKKIIKH